MHQTFVAAPNMWTLPGGATFGPDRGPNDAPVHTSRRRGAPKKFRHNQAATASLRPENTVGGFLKRGEVKMASASWAMFGHVLVTLALTCVTVTPLPAQPFRQPQVTMPIEDQPGYVPDQSAE